MSRFVLDASVAVAWLLDDEDEMRAAAALVRIETEAALVPQFWHLEVRNALLGAERRGRIRVDEVNERMRSLGELPVRTDTEPQLGTAFALARTHGLSMYDAVYPAAGAIRSVPEQRRRVAVRPRTRGWTRSPLANHVHNHSKGSGPSGSAYSPTTSRGLLCRQAGGRQATDRPGSMARRRPPAPGACRGGLRRQGPRTTGPRGSVRRCPGTSSTPAGRRRRC